MPKQFVSSLDGAGLRVGIAVSRFNSVVTERLLEGALATLARQGVPAGAIEVAHVPGAFELPFAIDLYARSNRIDAIVALGAVVRGETPHFDMIAQWVVAEIGRLSLAHRRPVALGVLTTSTIEQALERAGGKHGNKGDDAALAAIEMANLQRQFE
ncbi:MAG: 6,7-dimethyl-8-ribityllumazine synthase [Candidatus Binatia bacterium]